MLSQDHQRGAWALVVGLMVATAAYFQASGVSWLLAAELSSTISERPASAPPAAPPAATRERASGQAILERNPFDSITGPLSREVERPQAPAAPDKTQDPLTVPRCDGLRVDSTAESSDPLWSTAVMQVPSEAHGRVRRVGQAVAGKTIAYIGYNPRERSPAVWLSSAEGLCQSLLFDHDKARPAAPAPKPVKKPPARRSAPQLPKQLGDKIRKVAGNEFEVDRSAVDVIMNDYSKLMRGVIARPVVDGGKVAGLKLLRSTSGSLLDRLGLRNGDVVRAVNGFPLGSPESALKAYARLRTASEIRVELVRGGKPATVFLHIR